MKKLKTKSFIIEYTKENEPEYSYKMSENVQNIKTVNTQKGTLEIKINELDLKQNTEEKRYIYYLMFEYKDQSGRTVIDTQYISSGTSDNIIGEVGYYYEEYSSLDLLYTATRREISDFYYTYRYFLNCNELILQLKKAKMENTLARRLKHFTSYSVLIIDEVGFLPIESEDSNLLFQLISMRYEKHPTIFTTNKSFNHWGEVFGDSVIANAMLDRILHHCKVFQIIGPSYRMKGKEDLFKDD